MKKLCLYIILFVAFTLSSKSNSLYANNLSDSKKEIKIAVLMPLFYENIDDLAFNEYNIDERRNRNYKCFTYISFYEGIRIALDKFDNKDCKISLYVFDVGENDIKKTKQALEYEYLKDMDMIIALVFKQSFNLISDFCLEHKIALINPMSTDENILTNPYVFKIQPDDYSISASLLKYIQTKHSNDRIIVLYDDSFVKADVVNLWKENLPKQTTKWTILNYRKNSIKLKKYINKSDTNLVINLTKKNTNNENKTYSQEIINTLRTSKCNIELFGVYDWLEYIGSNFSILQDMNFSFSLPYYNDYTNMNFIELVKIYRENFKIDPDNIYASIGYDIIDYFVPLLKRWGKEFVAKPFDTNQDKMINRYKWNRKEDNKGWQNTNVTIYKLDNYKIKSCWSY